ncbi:centromere protein R isoform X2 [Aquarana catesbeiana]|uniref:centromere protein R isoform X2 n=1 Tax=Aquarana catesbeiana TaxID=8400 RepID=UPI003CC92EC5
MPVRRALHLGAEGPQKNPSAYSPLTGTRRMSPSQDSERKGRQPVGKKRREDPAVEEPAEPEETRRGQPAAEESDEILELFAQVEKSLDAFLKLRQHLKNLQDLEGNCELAIVSGTEHLTLDLRTEMQKTKVLISEGRKRKRQMLLV